MKSLTEAVVCIQCKGTILPVRTATELLCSDCGSVFKIINKVPCFVATELENFSEVAPHERARFLEMKKVAYGGGSLLSLIYNHYHRYAALKRSNSGNQRLIADVGFGMGEHYPFISAKEAADGAFIGVDLDRFKLEYFSSLHPEIPVMQASAFRLPFKGESVDTVQLLATLEHFSGSDIARIIDEAVRVLKPGGTLIACYPAEGGLLLRLCQLFMHPYLKWRSGFDLEQGAVHRHLTGAAEIRDILGGCMELERSESCFYPFGSKSVNLSLFINELYYKRII